MTTHKQVRSTEEALKALIHEMEYVLSCINADKVPFDGDDFHEALRLGKEALMSLQDGAQPEQRKEPEQEPVALEEYDAGLLNDFGGGNVEWWQDYIRAELGHAYEYYQSQMTTPPQRTWVGLTDEEIDVAIKAAKKVDTGYAGWVRDQRKEYAKAIEAKLKEKNNA